MSLPVLGPFPLCFSLCLKRLPLDLLGVGQRCHFILLLFSYTLLAQVYIIRPAYFSYF
jgi:hypothetical protein